MFVQASSHGLGTLLHSLMSIKGVYIHMSPMWCIIYLNCILTSTEGSVCYVTTTTTALITSLCVDTNLLARWIILTFINVYCEPYQKKNAISMQGSNTVIYIDLQCTYHHKKSRCCSIHIQHYKNTGSFLLCLYILDCTHVSLNCTHSYLEYRNHIVIVLHTT